MRKLILAILLLSLAAPLFSQEKIWEGTSCRNKRVSLEAFLPEGTPRAAIIVCPGGSYHWLDEHSEGVCVAEWLQKNGIAAYLLRYRVAGKFEFAAKYRVIFRGRRHPDMICDLQRSIQLVRERYDGPVGVMGFSAGGHLVMSGGEFFRTNFLERYGITPEVSLRPDFVVPVYPVVTFTDKRYIHKRSCLGLLGEPRYRNTALRDSLSLEHHVAPDTPPVFLVNCKDDPIVEWHNSVLLDSALTVKGIPHTYLQFNAGGHGFGADPERLGPETSSWQNAFLRWFENIIDNGY